MGVLLLSCLHYLESPVRPADKAGQSELSKALDNEITL